jgi:hypothetical protein
MPRKPVYSYLKQKCHFLNTKTENRSAEQVLSGGLVQVGGGRIWGEDVGGWTWCKYCVHMYANDKMRPVETILGIGGER